MLHTGELRHRRGAGPAAGHGGDAPDAGAVDEGREKDLAAGPPAGAAFAATPAALLKHFFSALLFFLRHLSTVLPVSALLRLLEPPLDAPTAQRLLRFRDVAFEKFDKATPAHREALDKLYSIAFPVEDGAVPPVDNSWKLLGFQSDDPTRDLRAIGIAGVRSLLFFADKFPEAFETMSAVGQEGHLLTETGDLREKYPFTISAFNVYMMLMVILGHGGAHKKVPDETARRTLARALFATAATEEEADESDAFHYLFCLAFMLLHREWHASRATYMNFPVVLEQTQQQVIDLAKIRITSVEDVVRLAEINETRVRRLHTKTE